MSRNLMRIRTLIGCAWLAMAVAATTSCGDVIRASRSPVLLVVNQLTGGTNASSLLLSDVVVEETSPDPCSVTSPCSTVFNDVGSATVAVLMKDVTITSPSTNNGVTINRYHVVYRRADGRNTPGVDVPYAIDGATTVTIPAGATGGVGFDLVRHTSKKESPLVQLRTNPNIISAIADVTLFGTDVVGNDVSVTGSISVNFGNFGDN